MTKTRLEAFSDGVIAILITIMILELKAPQGANWTALRPVVPGLLTYLLSFVYLGIYWTNHHHMLQATDQINGKILWANLHLLFWLSLVPFGTSWLAEEPSASVPAAAYGVILLGAGIAYTILLRAIITCQGENSRLAAAIGNDAKGKISTAIYVLSIPLAYVSPWLADACFILVAMMWLVPDPRIERNLQ